MKPGYLYMIVGNTSGHKFADGDLVVFNGRRHLTFPTACLCECEYGHFWWVKDEDVVEIGEI